MNGIFFQIRVPSELARAVKIYDILWTIGLICGIKSKKHGLE